MKRTLFLLCLCLLGVFACQEPPPTPTPTVTVTQAIAQATPSVTVLASVTATPVPSPTNTPIPTPATIIAEQFLPSIHTEAIQPTATLPPTNTPLPTPTPTLDFTAIRAELNANNQDLGFVKVGFHVGPGGNRNGLGEWMTRLDAAGVPFFLKSVDDSGALVEAQQLVYASGVPHTLVYRTTGTDFDVPEYDLPPAEAAQRHWQKHKATFPPELDRNLVWFETINEVDQQRSDWLAEFSLATAQLALAEGYRWAAFGWSSGEPEIADWESPVMLELLRLVADNPDRLAIALHEYSFLANDIYHEYPYKVGRFFQLFAVCDKHNIPRPTVLITEWGWEYQAVPDPSQAMSDIAWASRLYAPFPQIKGAAIWYLGPGFGGIANRTQPLIVPVTEYALGTYFPIPLLPALQPLSPDAFAP